MRMTIRTIDIKLITIIVELTDSLCRTVNQAHNILHFRFVNRFATNAKFESSLLRIL